ncbi:MULTISPECIES: hypoxanthine phosphoribosyltransferase [Apibacter]|uniref:hypoxanthine phosphoribosyltransferase n=1 Tax=Apibacter TaxID=1778601 RepID=UPI00132104A5|nr:MULTISPECIES: hypoxanthine phosphoribosyltransferase [Apibacter]MCX8676079.1 hypoxanthine phosphoribosyltransferase [Apibacter sp. B3919]MXO25375.1 hypoxanthine phosphoribosyltransferase [Apibacter sp. B3924]MXO27490.1 hypoxanthine phosphoribosyltransferase [Apibacter sp. B3813]MXO29303.1 hypoxanthine phosphoribosyltransferase [Apibacter sp. B3913]MXO31048.1 hypoxanthine phosphoribosyltransferase [Apibacter sp. B3912]
MEEIKILDKTFTPFISSEEIDHSIQRMTNTLYEEYKDTVPVFIGVLNGVIMFFSDFLKNYKGNCEIGFLQLSSYKSGMQSSGTVDLITDMTVDITNRDIVILEDIIDTGNTLEYLYKLLEVKPVRSIKIATLFFKPDVYKKDLNIDLIGMNIPNKFVIGYGLDYNGLGRNFKDLYQLKGE